MFKLFGARKSTGHILTISLTSEMVSLVIAKPSISGLELVVSDAADVEAKNYSAAIQQLFNNYDRFCKHAEAVLVVLGTDMYQSVSVDTPNLPAAEIAASLKYVLRDLVSLAPEQMIADYYDVPLQLNNQNKITAVVADKAMLLPIIQLFHERDLEILGIVAEEQALSALVAANAEPYLLVHQATHTPAVLQVYRGGDLQVNRVVRSLSKLSQLSDEEIGLGGLQPLVVEVQRSADYFERQLRQTPVAKVVIAARIPNQAACIQQLQDDLGLKAEFFPYPEWSSELKAGDYSDFPALAGAALAQRWLQESESSQQGKGRNA